MMTGLNQLLSKVTALGMGPVETTGRAPTLHLNEGSGFGKMFGRLLNASFSSGGSHSLKTDKPSTTVAASDGLDRLPGVLGTGKPDGMLKLKRIEKDVGEALDHDLSTLIDLLHLLARQSKGGETPLKFEFESESTGKLNVEFDPKTESLSILVPDREKIVSGSLVNKLRQAGFSKVNVAVGGHSKLKTVPTGAAERPAIAGVPGGKLASNAQAGPRKGGVNILVSKGILDVASDAAISKKAVAVAPLLVQEDRPAGSGKQLTAKGKPGLIGQIAKSGQSRAAASKAGVVPEGRKAPGISAKQALQLLARVLRGSEFAKTPAKDQRVTVYLDKAGKVTATGATTESGPRIEVASRARDWLKRALADLGIDIHESKVTVESEKLSGKDVSAGRISFSAAMKFRPRGVTDFSEPLSTGKFEPELDKAIVLLRKLAVKIRAKRMPSQAKQPLVENLEALVKKVEKSATDGVSFRHTISVGGKGAGELLQAELQPLMEQLVRSGVKIERLKLVDKQSGAIHDLTPDGAAATSEPADKKHIAGAKDRPRAQMPHDTDSNAFLDSEQDGAEQESGRKSFMDASAFVGQRGLRKAKGVTARATEGGMQQFVTALSEQGKFSLESGKAAATKSVAPSRLTEMIEKIAELSKSRMAISNQKLAVQLDVQGMGKVMVDAFKLLDKVHLQVHAETAELRRMLERQLQPLIDKISKDGSDIGKLDVSVRDQRSEQQTGSTFEKNEGGRRNPDFGDRARRFDREIQYGAPREKHPTLQAETASSSVGAMEIWA